MFTKGHFEGEYRSRPNVSIRGATTRGQSKEELLARAHQERALREAKRNEVLAVVRIQAAVRGFLDRRRLARRLLLNDIPRIREEVARTEPPDLNLLYRAGVLVVRARDTATLAWLCQVFVKDRQRVINLVEANGSDGWQYLIGRLAALTLAHLAAADTGEASCIRFLEIFTGSAYSSGRAGLVLGRLYRYLVARCEYFAAVRRLIDRRVPPLLGPTSRPPTPLAAEILQMISRPIRVAVQSQDANFRKEIFISFCREIFCPAFTEQVELFILPALCRPEENFPVGLFITLIEDLCLPVPASPQLLYCLLCLTTSSSGRRVVDTLTTSEEQAYIALLSTLSRQTIRPKVKHVEEDEDEDEEEDLEEEEDTMLTDQSCLVQRCVGLLNAPDHVASLVRIVEREGSAVVARKAAPAVAAFSAAAGALQQQAAARYSGAETVRNFCRLCHQLLLFNTQALHQYALLYSLAFRPSFLRQLWHIVRSTSQPSLFGSPSSLLSVIARGIKMSAAERDEIAPPLAVFVALFRYLLVTIHDTEFYGSSDGSIGSILTEVDRTKQQQQPNWMPFTLAELVPMSLSLRDVALGLVDLAYPDSRPVIKYEEWGLKNRDPSCAEAGGDLDVAIWSHLLKVLVALVRQLYNRDTRREFCPSGHWISARVSLTGDRPPDFSMLRRRQGYRQFRGLRAFTREELEEKGPPLSIQEVRLATVLRELPFTVAFDQRLLFFQGLIQRDKHSVRGEFEHAGRAISCMVRRSYIYEDAFEKLAPANEPDLRLRLKVQLVNVAGAEEAGVDGGGLFREFMTVLLKAAFDPNRGFFVLTRDQQLYPNPAASRVHPNSGEHYFFIGRMLGKALYEGLLVELPLASFFLSKLLGQTLVNVDIDHLDSLDPELYKNLLYLKTYEGDVQELGLDFTIAVEEFGETRIELLKPDGDQIPVTSENRIEYIHLVADYKLNRQIRNQCNAFRNGLEDVIGMNWLRMFSHRELQTLISGAEHEISLEDLQENTKYFGGYGPDHPTILAFWEVVRGMTEEEKRSLLKFVTSCSRPPLLGFRDLDPPFCIQNAGSEPNRLPTSATCMNLLKLPDFKDAAVLKKKLLYAIMSGAGFELS